MSDVSKTELLTSLGYASHHENLLSQLMEAGLTHPRKTRISVAKTKQVVAVLARHFLRVCRRGDCQARASQFAQGRYPVAATSSSMCELCGGSAAALPLREMQAACARAGWSRLCIVGGSPNARKEIRQSIVPPPEIMLVDGTKARSLAVARDDLAWADHVVLWGGTQLDHKVSNLYNRASHCSTVAKRSVQELWAHVARAAEQSLQNVPPEVGQG